MFKEYNIRFYTFKNKKLNYNLNVLFFLCAGNEFAQLHSGECRFCVP